MGFAPTTSSLARKRSTAELHPHMQISYQIEPKNQDGHLIYLGHLFCYDVNELLTKRNQLMSKKNKAKFKKQIKNQVLAQITKQQAPADNTPKSEIPKTEETRTPAKNYQPIVEIQNLPQIKADLKKTGIVVTCLATAIAVLVMLDQQKHILLTFGNFLFKVLHIQ